MAAGLWYVVAGSEKVESLVQVRVVYKGTPANYVILNGLVDRLEVRVRASAGLLRSVSGRNYDFAMDLSGLQLGENTLPLIASQLPFSGDVEVVEINPPRIQLDVDVIDTKSVPVEVKVQGEMAKGYTLQATVDPAEVALKGPATRLAAMASLPVVVNAADETTVGFRTESRSLILPDGVEASPPKVNVTVVLDHRRKQVRVTRTVLVENHGPLGTFVRPDKVVIYAALPESRTVDAATDPDIRAWVEPQTQAPGAYTLPVQVVLPAGGQLVRVEPENVVLTLEQGSL